MADHKKMFISLIVLILFAFYLIGIERYFRKENCNIIAVFSQRIEECDRTIKILRDSLALDSVLVITGSQAKIKSDSTGDSMIVSFGDINLRQWKKK